MDDSTPPNGIELELEAEASPVMSEALNVSLGSQRYDNTSNSAIDMAVTTVTVSNSGSNGPSTSLLGVSSVTDFLNSVVNKHENGLTNTPGTPSLYRFGRRVGEVHRHFSYCVREGKEYGMCLYCGHTLQRNTTRQKHHLSTHCPNAPIEVKARYDQERNSIHTRPAIEFQRKRNVDLVPGPIPTNVYGGEIEATAPISPMETPVKMERLEDRLETSHSIGHKQEKSYYRMAELEDEVETSQNVPQIGSVVQSAHYNANLASTRREMETSNLVESRFRKPFKVWDSSRKVRKGIVVSSLRELIFRSSAKLVMPVTNVTRAVLEEDGTEVDDEEYLEYLPDNTTLLLLGEGEEWKPSTPFDDSISRSRLSRIRNQSDRRDY